MGVPTSAILAETYIQYPAQTVICNILNKYQIIDYYRQTDEILIIYNTQVTNINSTLDEFNIIHPEIKFTMEKESHNKINYLDLTISKARNKLNMGIYTKPTTTDLVMPNDSCHLYEQKNLR